MPSDCPSFSTVHISALLHLHWVCSKPSLCMDVQKCKWIVITCIMYDSTVFEVSMYIYWHNVKGQ